ncbi:MAG: hypothetical protein KME21_11790 [Desmonostoc vinosum HA7617-LM4]|jgi:hypothetical protein|nr:hypothetical protein [Desmonostoc vinosum HA7617-LM4]
MKLSILMDSVVIVGSIALFSGIASAQPVEHNKYINDAAIAQQASIAISTSTNNCSDTINTRLEPIDLLCLAYQGVLKPQGISSGEALVSQTQNQDILALDLVKAAVNAKQLPPQILNDHNYLSAVESELKALPDYAAAD